MTINLVADGYGWGKGSTIADAIENYRKYNGRMKKGQKFTHIIITANSMEDAGINDCGELVRFNGAVLVSMKEETKL